MGFQLQDLASFTIPARTFIDAHPRMNIYAVPGDKVIFDANGGHDWEKRLAEKVIKLGETYEIADTNIGECSTDVLLKGFPDHWFNSCLFRDCDCTRVHLTD